MPTETVYDPRTGRVSQRKIWVPADVVRERTKDWKPMQRPAEDATPEGMQLVIPGCEKIQAAGPAQMVLF